MLWGVSAPMAVFMKYISRKGGEGCCSKGFVDKEALNFMFPTVLFVRSALVLAGSSMFFISAMLGLPVKVCSLERTSLLALRGSSGNLLM